MRLTCFIAAIFLSVVAASPTLTDDIFRHLIRHHLNVLYEASSLRLVSRLFHDESDQLIRQHLHTITETSTSISFLHRIRFDCLPKYAFDHILNHAQLNGYCTELAKFTAYKASWNAFYSVFRKCNLSHEIAMTSLIIVRDTPRASHLQKLSFQQHWHATFPSHMNNFHTSYLDHNKNLLTALRRRYYKWFQELLLDARTNLNMIDPNGPPSVLITLIQTPPSNRSQEVIQKILTMNVDLDVCDVRDRTALHDAVALKRIETVRLLLDHFADTNAETMDGENALMLACKVVNETARIELVKMLIRAGADVNWQDKEGRTALMHAVNNHDELSGETVKVLLEAGARKDVRDVYGLSAKEYARSKRNVSSVLN